MAAADVEGWTSTAAAKVEYWTSAVVWISTAVYVFEGGIKLSGLIGVITIFDFFFGGSFGLASWGHGLF